MKTYILANTSSHAKAVAELRRLLPGQENPWLLKAPDGDPIAYFNVEPEEIDRKTCCVTADMSGRHFDEDQVVISILQQLQTVIGGSIDFSP